MSRTQTENITGNDHNGSSRTRHAADRLHDQVENLAEKGERLEQQIRERSNELGENARDLGAGMTRFVRRHPWSVLGGTVAVGFLLGAMTRRQ